VKWTLETIRAVLEEMDKRYAQRFAAQESALASALASQKEAILKAEHATEKRFDSVNEFRGQLKDQTATFATTDRVNSEVRVLTDKLTEVTKRLDLTQGAGIGASNFWGSIISGLAGLAALSAIYGAFIKP
jgi:hypothetical protein